MNNSKNDEKMILVGPKLNDHDNVAITRDDDKLEVGVVSPLRDGVPISGDIIEIEGEENSGWRKIRHINYDRPAMVNSQSYRQNFDRIFTKNKAEN